LGTAIAYVLEVFGHGFDLIMWHNIIPHLRGRRLLHKGLLARSGLDLSQELVPRLVPSKGIGVSARDGREVTSSPVDRSASAAAGLHTMGFLIPWRGVGNSCIPGQMLCEDRDRPPVPSLGKHIGYVEANDASAKSRLSCVTVAAIDERAYPTTTMSP
jgi:hypothetical protein